MKLYIDTNDLGKLQGPHLAEHVLKKLIEERLPNFSESCKNPEMDFVVLHQDAFAADLQINEFFLLGLAVKYAGLFGKQVHFIGLHNETLKGA